MKKLFLSVFEKSLNSCTTNKKMRPGHWWPLAMHWQLNTKFYVHIGKT